jgi:deoxyribonuclease V
MVEVENWNVTPKEAVALQKELRGKIKLVPLTKKPQTIGGCDVSMNMFAKDGYAGFVVLDSKTLRMLDHSVVAAPIAFPYIPGLLSFREIPMLLEAWKKLKTKPDVLVVDGVGMAHPRRLGIATHLGLVLNIPTIGCAKSVLVGEYQEPADIFGAFSYMYDPKTKEVLGAAFRSKVGVKPIFISPGNLITLEESIGIIKACIIKHRLPEPTRLAHNTVNEYRVKELEK